MSKEENKYDIEDRLIDFTVRTIKLAGSLPKIKAVEVAQQTRLFGVELFRRPIMMKHKERNPYLIFPIVPTLLRGNVYLVLQSAVCVPTEDRGNEKIEIKS